MPEGGFFVLATSGIVRHKAGGLGLLVSTEIATSLALLAMTTTMPSLRANMVSVAISMGIVRTGLANGAVLLVTSGIATSLALLAITTTMLSLRANEMSVAISAPIPPEQPVKPRGSVYTWHRRSGNPTRGKPRTALRRKTGPMWVGPESCCGAPCSCKGRRAGP